MLKSVCTLTGKTCLKKIKRPSSHLNLAKAVRLWKGTELGTIHIAAFCTHPFPYHIRHIIELFCTGGGNAREQQEVTKVNIWNTQLISGREISTI